MPKLIVLLSICFFDVTLYAQSRQWPPRNEVSQDKSLNAFVDDLSAAVERKDDVFLMNVLDDDIMIGFDGESGKEAFRTTWMPEKSDSPIWPILARIVGMGGVFLHDTADETGRYQFVFPYVYDMKLELEDDPYTIGVITGKNVNLRSAPNTQASVVTQLSYDVITYLYEEDGSSQSGTNEWNEPEWYRIETIDRKFTGWVYWKYVYSPIGYRMFLYRDAAGVWKISTLIAGD